MQFNNGSVAYNRNDAVLCIALDASIYEDPATA